MNNNEIITFAELFEKIKKNIADNEELKEIEAAYNFALNVHKGKKRLNGDDFITHPLIVADIVNDLNVDAVTIEAALLHEVLDNGETSVSELEEKFGSVVATIVGYSLA